MFDDKGDIAMDFLVTFVIFGEVFVGILLSDMYTHHKEWFAQTAKQIRCILPVWMIQTAWAVVYYLLSFAFYLFYRNGGMVLHRNNVIDSFSVLFLLNMFLNKLHPYIFFKLRLTILALFMMLFVVLTGFGMAIVLGVNGLWNSFGLLIIYPLWCSYLFYLNLMWTLVERKRATGFLTLNLKQFQ